MAESRSYALDAQLDIQQILMEAQHRWLRPTEICAILQNHTKFCIGPEPPSRPPSGSLFLFDRKVLRYFRKDGHSWRRKKDGKTVKEAHERLKAGSVDVLHCYYAHGEDNENFQRRSYWMLEEDLSHIVLVHYLEVKGNRMNFNRIREPGVIPDSRQSTEDISNSGINSSAASKFQPYDDREATHVTDRTSLNSTQASEYEDAESAYRHQASPRFQSINELQSPGTRQVEVASVPYYPVPISNNHWDQFSAIPSGSFGLTSQVEKDKIPTDNGFIYEIPRYTEFPPREKVVESSIDGHQLINFQPSFPSPQSSAVNMMLGQEELMGQISGALGKIEEFGSHSNGLEEWQASECDTDISKWSFDQKSDNYQNLVEKTNYPPLRQPLWYDLTTEVDDVNQVPSGDSVGIHSAYTTEQSGHLITNDFQMQTSSAGANHLKSESTTVVDVEDRTYYAPLRQPLLESVSREGLRKLDSFDRWMNKELGDVTESNRQSGSELYWDTVGNGDGLYDSGISTQVPLDNYVLSPILSQDQFFTILDFSPTWAYSGSETKVLVMGKFLMDQEEEEKHKWACMFGELEVPAEIVANGVLRCYTPLHETGRVPFYVTCSNRLACSEVRDFDFRTSAAQDEDLAEVGNISSDETLLHMRFGKLLSLEPVTPQNYAQSDAAETSRLCSKISVLLKDDTEWEQMLNLSKQDEFSADKVKDQLLQKFLKEKLHVWLLQKVTEGGKGPSVLDEGGQGVLHFAAALGYDWAIPPTIAAGVSVNFRDVNGWTALHWAAYYGRERTVAFLISLGAAPGALTDPTPKYPLGRPPADLASTNGHKGISGYLAESELSSHLKSLDLKDSNESNIRENAVETVSERTSTPVCNGDLPHGLSLKDSLAALRNATQAAARIHQVFRVQSFQRKQFKEYGDSEFGMSDERALSLIGLKSKKAGPRDEPVYAAATRIQNKFRSWKGRKEFLLTRQRIIKIQAHVRGHQVRKSCKNITWSVGILDKVILRWRRKGRGLSGFKPEPIAAAGTSMQDTDETKEDDYDFLKQGRKQTEERLQKALARVKSMVQYPEARDQYRRLLNVVSEMQEAKATNDNVLNNPEMDFDVDLIDFEALFEDDTFMSTAL